MYGSKEMFQEEQERSYNEAEQLWHMQQQGQEYFEGPANAGPLPVLDLNALKPDDGIIKLDKDTLNVRSSDIALNIITSINDGLINPLEFAVKKKLVVDALDMVMKDPGVKKLAITEVESYGKESCSKLGAKITISSRPAYKYDQDPTWKAIKNEMQPFEEKLKAQEEKIKAACKNGASLTDTITGEIIASVVPAPATESISVSFSKK
jgi:hypothetical protein